MKKTSWYKEVPPGTRFSRLVVRQRSGRNDRGDVMFDCACDCGNASRVSGSNLRAGEVKSCGCLVREQLGSQVLDITGERLGTMTAVDRVGRDKHSQCLWRLVCDCGRDTIATTAKFRSGRVKCWTCRSESKLKIPTSSEVPDAYFAGLFDGEGCVRLAPRGKTHKIDITIGCVYKPVLEAFKKRFGGSNVTAIPRRPSQMSMKAVRLIWSWRIRTIPEAVNFIRSVLPFSMEKKAQLELALAWLEDRLKQPRNYGPEFEQSTRDTAVKISVLKRQEFLN